MESTLLRSRRSSSSCSRIEGVIRERMISERFSRLMKKDPRPARSGPAGAEPTLHQRREEVERGGGRSCCPSRVQPATGAFDAFIYIGVNAAQFVLPALGNYVTP